MIGTDRNVTHTVLVLVKANPVLTRATGEAMCVAGITLDSRPRWIRLHPIPFRDLERDEQFRKYQIITVKASKTPTDHRPETWVPHEGTITLGSSVGTEHGWSHRRELVAGLGEQTMCDLQAENQGGHGIGVPSLGVVRPAEPPELIISRREEEQLRKWAERAAAWESQPSLFGRASTPAKPAEPVPWRFRYKYRCQAASCGGHQQTIIDWELVALWRKVRSDDDWEALIRHKFVDDLWSPKRDTVMFVGNQHQRPKGFLILGVFWPPRTPLQGSLL